MNEDFGYSDHRIPWQTDHLIYVFFLVYSFDNKSFV